MQEPPTNRPDSIPPNQLLTDAESPSVQSDTRPRLDLGETVARSLEINTKVTVTVPREINVKLVEVKSLQEYEVWTWVTSILLSAVTGFYVAYSQSGDQHLLASASVFGLLSVIAIGRTLYTRWWLTKRSDKIRCDDTS